MEHPLLASELLPLANRICYLIGLKTVIDYKVLLRPSFIVEALQSLFPLEQNYWHNESHQKNGYIDWKDVRVFLRKVMSEYYPIDITEDVNNEYILGMYELVGQICEAVSEDHRGEVTMKSNLLVSKGYKQYQKKRQKDAGKKIRKEQSAKAMKSVERVEQREKSKYVNRQLSKNSKSPKVLSTKALKMPVDSTYLPLQALVEQYIAATMAKSKSVREQNPFHDKMSYEMLQYQKRKLDYYLKTYNKNTLQTSKSVSKPYELDAYQLKILSLKQRKAQEEIMNQQLKYYITLREKKVSYVKHVHKLIEKLYKYRGIDLNKRRRYQHAKYKQQASYYLEKANVLFETNMEYLRAQQYALRKYNYIDRINEYDIWQQMYRSLKQKQTEEINAMRTCWEHEQEKLKLIVGDEEKIKQKLLEIYRRTDR